MIILFKNVKNLIFIKEDEAEKDAADDVMEAGEKKGGRPRGAPHIENVRFWDLPESSLKYIIKELVGIIQI